VKERGHLGGLDVDVKIILELTLRNRVGGYGLYSLGSRQCPVAGSCKHCNEIPDSIKGREFLAQLSNYQLLKKVSVP
jgi:hypothetical protein